LDKQFYLDKSKEYEIETGAPAVCQYGVTQNYALWLSKKLVAARCALEAAQAKDSTATDPQQTQAVICSNNECAYCDKTDRGCPARRDKCVGFNGRKLTAC
jgi:hypothetical protein